MRALITYIEGLTISQGEGAGQPMRLLPWERRFLSGAFRVAGDGALSIARGNGKTTLVAAVAAACVDGPLTKPRGEVVICASSFSQARVGFEHTLAFLLGRGHDLDDRKLWRRQDSQNAATLEFRPSGARVRCIGSDPSRAHGLAPALVLADEPAQWPVTTSDRMLAALRTSMGKLPGSRMVALGTRPADESHWFALMLSGGCDYAQSHHASPDDPPFRKRTWAKANPSLPAMPELEKRIRLEAQDARRDPSLLAGFLALRLNLGTSDTEQTTLLDAGTWQEIEGQAELGGAYVLGVDLGGAASMSAAVGYWPDTGALHAVGCFGSNPDLAERGLRDGVGRRYVEMAKRGELILAEGRVPDVPTLLLEALERWGTPAAIVADRWREAELRDGLERCGFPRCPLVLRGQGFLDGGEDVRSFRQACLRGRVTPARSLLMRSAMSEARVVSDTAANWKLAKTEGGRRHRAKDDAAAAGVLAVAHGFRRSGGRARSSRVYLGVA